MKSARARWRAHRTLGATRRWTTTGYATAQWKARSARRCQPPPGPTLTNRNFFSFCGGPNPCPLDQSSQAKHHHFDPRKQTPGGRHQIGTPAGFKSESVAGFLLECVAGFVGIRNVLPNSGNRFRLSRCKSGGRIGRTRRPDAGPVSRLHQGASYRASDGSSSEAGTGGKRSSIEASPLPTAGKD